MATADVNAIREGDHVLLRKSGNLRLVQVHKTRDVWLDRMKFRLDGTIGHPYGSKFEVKNGQMVKLNKNLGQDADKPQPGADAEKDNRFLLDSDSNQKLTADEIDQLKKDGVTGDKLIEQLIENSTTYETKTDYAQEKWVKKKKKKHLQEFTVLKPTSRLMCEFYWSKGPTKICNLRMDSLAQILSLGNVRAGSTVMVVDTCLGLVTGAVLERLAGFGKVISFYHGDSPMKTPLDAYDFSSEVMDSLHYFPLEQVNLLKHGSVEDTEKTVGKDPSDVTRERESCNGMSRMNDSTGPQASTAVNPESSAADQTASLINLKDSSTNQTGALLNLSLNQTAPPSDTDLIQTGKPTDSPTKETGTEAPVDSRVCGDKTENQSEHGGKSGQWKRKGKNKRKPDCKERMLVKEERAKKISIARNILLQKDVDCLIVACKFHPSPIVTALLDLMAPSRQVVVFSQFQEALEDCYTQLRENGGLVSFRLSETWLRQYQVLPNRTHPVIQMNGTGGYVFSATTIVKQP